VADTRCGGDHAQQSEPLAGRGAAPGVSRAGGALAHPHRECLALGAGLGRHHGAQQPAAARDGGLGLGLGPFPPAPGNRAAWGAVLEADPSLEPALCGVADGLADRVDRLRACGNGVVPLAAAYAFLSLLADLEADR